MVILNGIGIFYIDILFLGNSLVFLLNIVDGVVIILVGVVEGLINLNFLVIVNFLEVYE